MIARHLLAAFGFVPAQLNAKGKGKGKKVVSYYNQKINMMYDPAIHSDARFAQNLMRTVAFKTRTNIKNVIESFDTNMIV